MVTIIIATFGVFVAAFAGYFFRRYVAEKKVQDAEAKAKQIGEQAKKEAEAQDAKSERGAGNSNLGQHPTSASNS